MNPDWARVGLAVLAGALALILIASAFGCERETDGARPPVTADAGPREQFREVILPDGTKVRAEAGAPIDLTITERSEGVGSGITSNSEEVVASMDLSAPMVLLNSATGGGVVYSMKITGASEGVLMVYGLGALLCVGGVLIGWLGKSPKTGAAVFAAGACVILLGRAIEEYPWAGLAIPLVVLAAGVYVVVEIRRGRAAGIALGTVVRAVEAVNGHGEPVKEQVKVLAGANRPTVDAAVKAAKRKEGLS